MMMRRRPIARMAVRTTAVVGTAAVVGGHMANKQAEAQAAQAPAAEPQAAPAPAAAPAAAGPDPVAQLTQLAALKDSGALTEAEFEAEKAKILS
jgi:membrane protease subunit (stomatin/prohibitin family)